MDFDLKTPNWTLVVELNGKRVETTTYDASEALPDGVVPEGARFSVSGTPTPNRYVYVIETGARGRFVVIDKPVGPASGPHVLRRPLTGWFTAPFNGTLRVVESPVEIADADWDDLLDGRDPPPKGNSPKNMGAADVPKTNPKPTPKPKETK